MKRWLSAAVLLIGTLSVIHPRADGQGWYKYNSIAKYYSIDKMKKPCHDRPLEEREKNAAVIFTGTIREMEPDWRNPEMQRAKIEIKRVMKGGYVLSRLPHQSGGTTMDFRRIVVVEGFGDPEICHSEARKHDTRIFLVNKGNNGDLRLNSSLIRMTLENINKTEAAMKERATPKFDYYHRTEAAMMDTRDPCRGQRCSFGARCVASMDGLASRCQCPERCDSFGDSEGSGVVCGSDGRSYATLCEMKKRACEDMRDVEKKYDGKCDPCDGFECPSSQICLLDSSRRPFCGCDALCRVVFEPVCGSNGKTYINDCMMKVDACRSRTEILLMFPGECTSTMNPCHGVICGPNSFCAVDSSNAPHCTCPRSCDPVLKAVCGSDGHTYPSECHLRRQSCLEKRVITVVHVGECNSTSVCTNHVCAHEAARCIIRNHLPVCVCPLCSEEYQPVCGSDGVTYSNECKLKTENCEKRTMVSVVHRGACDPCEKKKCNFYRVCVSDGRGNAQCVCPPSCRQDESKVCGSDGSTYRNECELRMYSCQHQRPLVVASHGPCDPCADVKCPFGAKCVGGNCTCNFACRNAEEPICGSDDITYSNECLMHRISCVKSMNIEAVHAGACEENSGSGDEISESCDPKSCQFGGMCKPRRNGQRECICNFNCDAVRYPVCGTDGRMYSNECQMKEESCRKQMNIRVQPMDNCEDIFEEVCDGKPPLVNPITGKEYDCSLSNHCPAGSYCDKQSGAGKCCSGDQPNRKCIESRYGCCSDDMTPASGPNGAGCPNVCHCHVLGANGTSCNPVTRQCVCKPGVGGLKCDRCSPKFWGLPKISEGNNGCIPCDCNVWGSMRDDCEQMTGRCVCRPGITGQKCNICPSGKQMEGNNCPDHLMRAQTCVEKQCRFGALCQMSSGVPECICLSNCTSEDNRVMMVCGSDGQTYGSACQLQRFACRIQKEIRVVSAGSCQKTTAAKIMATSPPMVIMKMKKSPDARVRVIKDLTNPTNSISINGMLEDFCEDNKDCFVVDSYCKNGLCVCKDFRIASSNKKMCLSERFVIPSFAGRSYLQLKRLNHGSRDVSVEIHFQPQRENGILVYAGQNETGSGDFLSLSLKNGHVEFRYDLGSGATLLKTMEKVRLGMFHKVTAMRFGKDGVLKLDEGQEVSGTSPGTLRSLNLMTPIFLGFVPNMTHAISKNIGVDVGFVGCVESLSVKSSELNVAYDLTQDSSIDIEHHHDIRECGVSTCASFPCQNNGACLELDGGINFRCNCSAGYKGVRCEEKTKNGQMMSCASNPCHNGGSCLQLDKGHFVCNCPAPYDGERCERVFKHQHQQTALHSHSIATPQFHGNSFLILRLSKTTSRSVSFEIWFLPNRPDGVLLYSVQENEVRGDFLSLNLINGHAQLRFNLGSGVANITSQTAVRLGMWNKVVMSRLSRLGSLSLNDDIPAKGQSGGDKKELNLPTRIYVGGYPDEFNPDSKVKSGFVGAIQKFLIDKRLVKNLLAESLMAVNITQYNGPPCPRDENPCHNGGKCVPNLNDFECQCADSFSGITCQIGPNGLYQANHHPVAFNGRTRHRYDSVILEKNQVSNKFEMKFRTSSANGLLLLIRKSSTVEGDYLAIAISGGHVQASFNLGMEKPSRLLFVASRVPVVDGRWHNLTFTRNQRSAHLYVDHDRPTTAVVSTVGATRLNTNGHLWIGGSTDTPDGLPRAYYTGFKGCIEFVRVDNKIVNLVEDRDMQNAVSFCGDDN